MGTAGVIRVLHVDDEPALADVVAAFLEREYDRINVETATSPSDGLQLLADCEIDCVVSDYDMPGMNGIEFLDAVREQFSELPFILYTGKGSEEIASDAISAGVTDYLQKESGTSHYTVLANRIRNAVDQYRSRQAVANTEWKLSELADRTDDILFMFNRDWSELLFINSAYEETFGGSIDELQEQPTSFLELVHPEDRDKARASMEQLSNGSPSQVEYRIIRPDGEHRWVRGETQPVQDEGGNEMRIIGQVRDITEEKERELHLETIIDNLPGYVYRHEYDSEYPLTFVKGDAETITGYTATELEEEIIRAEEIIHPEDRTDLWANHLEGLEETGRFDSTYRIITKDGDVRWIRDQGQLIADPVTGEQVIDGFITDISEQIERKQELEVKNQRLDAILDNTTTVMFMKDDDGRYIFANRKYRKLFGLQDGTIRGQTDYDLHPPDVAKAVRANDRRVIENGEPLEIEEQVLVDGAERIFLSSKVPIYDTGERADPEEPVAVFGVASDITEIRRREEHIQRERDRLDEFASVVSHDIRNPLGIAEGRLELLREECDSEHIDPIDRALTRMNTLIEDLLTLARGGQYVSETEIVDLADLSEDCWRNVDTADAKLRTPIESRIRADRSRLAQLLENLIRNAVVHGGDDVTVTVGKLTDGFYVEDDSVGIPEDERNDVFGTGYSTAEDGTGFGLSIVNQIVEAHGWEMRVTDGDDGGARFEIAGVICAE